MSAAHDLKRSMYKTLEESTPEILHSHRPSKSFLQDLDNEFNVLSAGKQRMRGYQSKDEPVLLEQSDGLGGRSEGVCPGNQWLRS